MTNFSQISVIGCGRWGGFLGYYCAKYKNSHVLFLGVPQDPAYQSLIATGNNGYVTMPENVSYTTDMLECLKNDFVIVSIGCQGFRGLCRQLSGYDLKGKTFLLAMKGLEENTALRMSQVFQQEISEPTARVVCLMGPGHVQDYIREIPSCVVLDSPDETATHEVADYLNSSLIRTYYGADLIGNEVGAAMKNVIGLAAGILDGLGWSGLKGALMARAPVEVGRLIEYFGGNPQSAYGLAHLGDYEATLFSPHSHNRAYGERLVNGPKFEKLAEGVPTLAAVYALRDQVDMPICRSLYRVVYENQDPKYAIGHLFRRENKVEFKN
ncbi:MAG: glycerol-3-phosphate dehydrogenase [Alphaproteobacteria bacterium]|nr:glycerol-3-phosphate dehydrogenase [Alphaproteobacteria bacterium]